MAEYIEKEEAVWLLEQSITMSMCLTVDECHHKRNQRLIDCALVKGIPPADVVPREQYNKLLQAATAMHEWIFLNAADEEEAYAECGLTDEMNALLGYVGSAMLTGGGVGDGDT